MSLAILGYRIQIQGPSSSSLMPIAIKPATEIFEDFNRFHAMMKAKVYRRDRSDIHEFRAILGRLACYINHHFYPESACGVHMENTKSMTIPTGRGSIDISVQHGVDGPGTYQLTAHYLHGSDPDHLSDVISRFDDPDSFFQWPWSTGEVEWNQATQLSKRLAHDLALPHIVRRVGARGCRIRVDGKAPNDIGLAEERIWFNFVVEIILGKLRRFFFSRDVSEVVD